MYRKCSFCDEEGDYEDGDIIRCSDCALEGRIIAVCGKCEEYVRVEEMDYFSHYQDDKNIYENNYTVAGIYQGENLICEWEKDGDFGERHFCKCCIKKIMEKRNYLRDCEKQNMRYIVIGFLLALAIYAAITFYAMRAFII